MKKSQLIFIILGGIIFNITILFFVLGIFTLAVYIGVKDNSVDAIYLSKAEEIADLNLDSGKIVKFTDTHGGFFGEGDAVLEVEFFHSDYSDIVESISTQAHWEKLPMEKDLKRSLMGLDFELPQNGYFLFYDRHTDADSHYDYKEMLDMTKRYSVNFSVLILDDDAEKMIFLERDT